MPAVVKTPTTERVGRVRNSDRIKSICRMNSASPVRQQPKTKMAQTPEPKPRGRRRHSARSGSTSTAPSAEESFIEYKESNDSVVNVSQDNTPAQQPAMEEHIEQADDSMGVMAPVIHEEKDLSNEKVGSVIEHFYKKLSKIDFNIVGGTFSVIGTDEVAERITRKFKIMQKLAHLVGCGLDCHFRFNGKTFRLMMLIRGAPRVVFGAMAMVIPDLTNISHHATPAEFVEAAQDEFFDSVLRIFPHKMRSGKHALQFALQKGEEDSKVLKFYEFCKNIRGTVLSHIATLPIVWTVEDEQPGNGRVDMDGVYNVLQLCGDIHLTSLESKDPGYTERWCAEWGVTQVQTFIQMMDERFNSF